MNPRLAAKFTPDPETGCWEWTGCRDSAGYGRVQRLTYGTPMAYRAVYEDRFGPIPDGLTLDHLCRNRGCVNPDHLEPVPQRENVRRGVSKVAAQMAQTACLRGHDFSEHGYISSQGKRRCRSCDAIRDRKYRVGKKVDAIRKVMAS